MGAITSPPGQPPLIYFVTVKLAQRNVVIVSEPVPDVGDERAGRIV